MKSKRFHFSMIGIILGTLLFIFVGVIATWGDMRSITFDNQRLASEKLETLQCPIVITSNETGTISATITNELNRQVPHRIRAVISNSNSSEPDRIEYEFTLNPDESQELTWPITPANAEENHFILIRVHQIATYTLPLRNASCGVLVVDLPFLTGAQLIFGAMGLATLLSGFSLLILGLTCMPRGWKNPVFQRWLFFNVVALIMASIALTGYWGGAAVTGIIWLMQAIEFLHFFSSRRQSSEPIVSQ